MRVIDCCFDSRYKVQEDGVIIGVGGRPLKPKGPNQFGYYRVHIGGKCGKTKYVHRCVLQSFKPMPFPGLEVDHIDGDPSNNNLSNLRWTTKQLNNLYKRENENT